MGPVHASSFHPVPQFSAAVQVSSAGLSIPVQDATLHSPPPKTTPKGLVTTWTVMMISDVEDQDSDEI